MTYSFKLRQIGNSEGVVFPKKMVAQLRAETGDTLYATPVPGGFTITTHDERRVQQMKAAETVMKNRRNLLKALASS